METKTKDFIDLINNLSPDMVDMIGEMTQSIDRGDVEMYMKINVHIIMSLLAEVSELHIKVAKLHKAHIAITSDILDK